MTWSHFPRRGPYQLVKNGVSVRYQDRLIVDYVGVFRDLQRALAICGTGAGGSVGAGDMPVQDKNALVDALRDALADAVDFCAGLGVSIEQLQAAPSEWEFIRRRDDTVEAILVDQETKQAFLAHVRVVNKLFKAILPHPSAGDFSRQRAILAIIAARIQSLAAPVDISDVMERVDDLLDESVAAEGYVIADSTPDQIIDPVGNLLATTYPSGDVVSYAYDALDRQTGMTDPQGQSTTYSYDPVGNLMATGYPNGVAGVYGYDANNRLLSLAHNGPSGVLIYANDLVRDPVGNVTAMTERFQTGTGSGSARTVEHSYDYDALDRLLEEVAGQEWSSGETTTRRYTYDAVGNRLSELVQRRSSNGKTTSTTTDYAYDEANRLVQAGSTAFQYDANGNRVEAASSSLVERYSYDYESQLTGYSRLIPQKKGDPRQDLAVTYAYDGLGRRVLESVTNNGQAKETRTQYDGFSYNPLVTADDPGQTTELFYGAGYLAATRETQSGGNGATYYRQPNWRGDVALITNQSGGSAHQYFYTPYGELLDNNGKLLDSSNFTGPHNQYTLTGKPLDAESGLTYFGARYYDAANGAWLTRDPLPGNIPNAAGLTQVSPALGKAFFGAYSFSTLDTLSMRGSLADPLGRNRYLFNRANPLSFIDPTGCASTGPGGCVIPNHPWLCPPPSGSGAPSQTGGGAPPPTGGGSGDDPDLGYEVPGPWWPLSPPPPPPPPPSNGRWMFGSDPLRYWLPRPTQQWANTQERISTQPTNFWETQIRTGATNTLIGKANFNAESQLAIRNLTPMADDMMRHPPSAYPDLLRGMQRGNLNFRSAVNAYDAGERRPLALAAHATGVANALIGGVNFTTQWRTDMGIAFSNNTPWYDRLPSAVRIGWTGTQTAGAIVGTGQLAYRGVSGAVANAQANALTTMLLEMAMHLGPVRSEQVSHSCLPQIQVRCWGGRRPQRLCMLHLDPTALVYQVAISVKEPPPTATYDGPSLTAYRVEGTVNQRLSISQTGDVSTTGNQRLYVNLGQEGRATSYYNYKVQDGLPGARLATFEVDQGLLVSSQ